MLAVSGLGDEGGEPSFARDPQEALDVVGAGAALEGVVDGVRALGGRSRLLAALSDSSTLELVAHAEVLCVTATVFDRDPTRQALDRAVSHAHDHDTSVALFLADRPGAPRGGASLLELVTRDVDVLFGSDRALRALFGAANLEAALDAAEETGILTVVTRGKAGSTVLGSRGRIDVPPDPLVVAGAQERAQEHAPHHGSRGRAARGDRTRDGERWYVAGFLYGLTHGERPEGCARLGALCAAEAGAGGAVSGAELRALAQKRGLL